MATKTTKNNKNLTYPCIVNVCMAMGQKRKTEVIRALDRVTGDDLSKSIVYPTLRNAYYAGVDLVKESIDSKWVRIEKTDAEARQITIDGEVTGIDLAPPPAPVAPKQPKANKANKAKKAKKAKAATAANSKKGKTKTTATGGMTIEQIEPTADQILEEEAGIAFLAEDTIDSSYYDDQLV